MADTPLSIPELAAEIRRTYEPCVLQAPSPRENEPPVHYLLTPHGEGMAVRLIEPDFEAHAHAPRAKRGTARAASVDAFCALTGYHATDTTRIFAAATDKALTLTAVIDYHGPQEPQHGRHRIVCDLPLSREWLAWTGKAGTAMGQGDFAAWVETRLLDIVDPPAALDGPAETCPDALRHIHELRTAFGGRFADRARMAELAKGLEVHADTRAAGKINLDSGETQIAFAEEHRAADGGAVRVPNLFVISVPVFDRGTHFLLPVRLRYRLKEGRILWHFDLIDPAAAIETARARVLEEVMETTTIEVFEGAPEA